MANAIVDLVGHTAWPAVALGLGYMYREDLRTLLSAVTGLASRIRRVGPAEFQETAARQVLSNSAREGAQDSKSDGAATLTAEQLLNDPTIKPWLDQINEFLRANNLIDAPDLKERLLAALAQNSRELEFRTIADRIFGTQLAALKEIEASGSLGMSALQELHSEHETRVLLADSGHALDLLSWIGFLRDTHLISLDESSHYKLTEKGRLFVRFANANGVNETRPF